MFLYKLFELSKSRIFFSIVTFLFLFANSSAQENISLGAKYGYGMSRCYFMVGSGNDDYVEQDFVPVYQAGLVFNHTNSKNMGLQIEIQYIKKAWQEKFKNLSTRKVVVDYAEIPVLTHARFGKKRNALFLNAGLYGAYALKIAIDTVGEIDLSIDTAFINYNDLEYSKYDYGFKAALGYEMGIGKSKLQFQVEYSQSLQNIIERNRVKLYRSLNQGLFFSIIYKFQLYRREEVVE